jgi:hypothetical protein
VEKEGLSPNLQLFFSLFRGSGVAGIKREFLLLTDVPAADMTLAGGGERLRSVYEQAATLIEDRAAEQGFPDDLISLQQALYRELEHLLSLDRRYERHHFLVVIPVADRPAMLGGCVRSLIQQCLTFGYGGTEAGHDGKPFCKNISLLIFDDSREEKNRNAIRDITQEARDAGIRSRYIGLEEQAAFLARLQAVGGERLSRLIGEYNETVLPHKGASLTRNIAYLFIQDMLKRNGAFPAGEPPAAGEKVLVYFLDSDEEFVIRVRRNASVQEIPFINYFYLLDRIFGAHEVEVMTGKVVGDPPVTPAVMINTFLEDLILFFEGLPALSMQDDCPFHGSHDAGAFSADYHDLGKLFGYRPPSLPKQYRCDLQGEHTAKDCFDHLSKQAIDFFYGLHPTRVQVYHHPGGFMRTEQARTVYTGNYVFTREGLRHFIPFADLGLRMAGPTLGRILKSKIGDRFVSANLPLLHKRTVPGAGAEFRNGIIRSEETVDLSTECSRQFWGDVMLFSVESLASAGYPAARADYDVIAATVRRTQEELWELYREKFAKTDERVVQIRHHLSAPGWWNSLSETEETAARFGRFCDLSERNFGMQSEGFKKLSEQIAKGVMLNRIIESIHLYCEDEKAWNGIMEEIAAPTEAGPGI